MAKDEDKDKRRKKKKAASKLQKRARRDVALEQQPYIDQLERSMSATENAYGGYEDLLGDMQGQYQGQTNNIAGDLMAQYKQLAGMLGGSAPASEAGAANTLFGGAGAGALGILSGDQQRNVDFQRSAQREGGLASRYGQDNIIQQMNDLYSQRPQMIRQRTDELKDFRLQSQLAKSQMSSDDAFNEFLQNQIGGLLDGGGGGGRSGGGGGGGGGNAGGFTGRNTGASGGNLPPTDTSVGGNNFGPPPDGQILNWIENAVQRVPRVTKRNIIQAMPTRRKRRIVRNTWNNVQDFLPDSFGLG